MDPAWLDDLLAWRQQLDESLSQPFGWLSLIGLHWLRDGPQRVGRHPACDIQLDSEQAPAVVGQLSVTVDGVHFQAAAGVKALLNGHPIEQAMLSTDSSAEPSLLQVGSLQLAIVERERRLGLRVWDRKHPNRLGFPGRQWHPPRPEWRLPAEFLPAAAGTTIVVPNELGTPTADPLAGRLRFSWDGQSFDLAAIDRDRLWFAPFADASNGAETYGAGRFLYVEPADGPGVSIDFNYAYNPPCAFTSYATCPLPPAGNRLPIAVDAGELKASSA